MIDVIYHIGHLAVDRDTREPDGSLTEEAKKLHEKAAEKLDAAEQGKLVLYQRRCIFGFEYHCRPIKGA